MSGTHTGEFQHLQPTGKSVTAGGFVIYVLRNNKIISSEVQTDRVSFLQQLGLLPLELSTLSLRKLAEPVEQ
jgi:predicted ester cyclase